MRTAPEERHELKAMLRSAGLRATRARIHVLECLRGESRALSHAEVCDRLHLHGFDRATLYRNLMDLTEAGLTERRDLGDHTWRFQWRHTAGHDAHAHFECAACGEVSCLPESAVAIRAPSGTPKSLRDREVDIRIRGVCDACD